MEVDGFEAAFRLLVRLIRKTVTSSCCLSHQKFEERQAECRKLFALSMEVLSMCVALLFPGTLASHVFWNYWL